MTNPSEDPRGMEGHIGHLNNAPHVGSSAKGNQSQCRRRGDIQG